MSGCAAPSHNANPGIRTAVDEAFSFDARAALPSESSSHFQTGLSAKLDTPVAEYQSDYSITTGALVQSMAEPDGDSVTMPMEVARQTVRQSDPGGFFRRPLKPPVKMGLDWSHERAACAFDGEKRSESSASSPQLATRHRLLLEMAWTAPRRFATAGTPFRLHCRWAFAHAFSRGAVGKPPGNGRFSSGLSDTRAVPGCERTFHAGPRVCPCFSMKI